MSSRRASGFLLVALVAHHGLHLMNKDGTEDVADIATIIDRMAGE